MFAAFAPLAYAAHGADGTGIWLGGDAGGDEALSNQLHAAWGAFAATGDPGWARYTTDDRKTMVFDPAGSRVSADPFASVRAAWAGLDWQPGTWWAY
jgi:carboxylesterase type B